MDVHVDGDQSNERNESLIHKLSEAFKDSIVVDRQHVFFLYDRNGQYVGSCKINHWTDREIETGRFIVIDYTDQPREAIVRSIEQFRANNR